MPRNWPGLLYHILSFVIVSYSVYLNMTVHDVSFRALKCRPQRKTGRTDLSAERNIVDPTRDPLAL